MKQFLNFCKRYVYRYLWWYVIGFFCILGTQSLILEVIEETKNAIDAFAAEGSTPDTVIPFAIKIAIMAPLIVLIRTASRLLIFTPGRLSEYHIRNDYYANLLYLQRDFFAHHGTGDLVSRCSNDIGFVRGAFGFGFLQVANVSVTLVLVMAKMLSMSPKITGFLAIPLVISFAIIQLSIHYMFSYWRKANVQLGDLSTMTLSAYKGVSAIQNYHAEPAVETRFYETNNAYLDTMRTITKTRTFVLPLVQLVGYLSIFMVLWFAGVRVIEGAMSLGELVAFTLLINMIMPPLLSLGWMLNVFNRALPAIERLDEILRAEPNVHPSKPGAAERVKGPISLRASGLACSFPESSDPFKMKDINFNLQPGKVLGVVGPVGSGKTALLDSLVRLNSINENALFISDVDATHLKLEDYRQHISFTPQKALLFSTSLRRNLMTALTNPSENPQENEARLLEALELAGFQLDPKQFPDGLETEVGEKGVMLSGGQRQRIALARALLKKSDIYILDDVLSAVDHDTEKKIIANLRRFAPGKSFIIASHRVSAIQWADEILVLEDGRIQDRGTHGDLVSRPGFYRDIYEYQSEHPDEDTPWN